MNFEERWSLSFDVNFAAYSMPGLEDVMMILKFCDKRKCYELFLDIQTYTNKAKQANKVRRVDRRTNALPDQPTDQRTQPIIEVLCRT